MRLRLLPLFLLLLPRAASAAGESPSEPSPAQVETVVRSVMEARHAPGVSLAVVRDGKVVLARGFGLADVELDAPTKPETLYELASVTKQFTAAAVMMLV